MNTMRFAVVLGLLALLHAASAATTSSGRQAPAEPNRPGFPFFNLPSLQSIQSSFPALASFNISALSLPSLSQLPSLSSLSSITLPNPFSPAAPADPIKATKTEYVEVTRRQTIHPVCYTAASNVRAPCLPVRGNPQELELNTEHQVHNLVDIDIRPTETLDAITPTRLVDNPVDQESVERDAKYLEFREKAPSKEKIVQVETSEENNNSVSDPLVRQNVDLLTKTVLVTKLERFTDHRVTATMLALNCLPVDPKIPRCHSRSPDPIVESPSVPASEAVEATPNEAIIDASSVLDQVSAVVEAAQKVPQELEVE